MSSRRGSCAASIGDNRRAGTSWNNRFSCSTRFGVDKTNWAWSGKDARQKCAKAESVGRGSSHFSAATSPIWSSDIRFPGVHFILLPAWILRSGGCQAPAKHCQAAPGGCRVPAKHCQACRPRAPPVSSCASERKTTAVDWGKALPLGRPSRLHFASLCFTLLFAKYDPVETRPLGTRTRAHSALGPAHVLCESGSGVGRRVGRRFGLGVGRRFGRRFGLRDGR